MDLSGRTIANGMIEPLMHTVDVSTLLNGTYLLHADQAEAVRFVIQH